jgi:hypothetical protein
MTKWAIKLPHGFEWRAVQNAQKIEVIGGEDSSQLGEETFYILGHRARAGMKE